MTATTTAHTTMLMNAATGSVATIEEWKADFAEIATEDRPEIWGGQNFEDADLVEVVWDEGSQTWIEAE